MQKLMMHEGYIVIVVSKVPGPTQLPDTPPVDSGNVRCVCFTVDGEHKTYIAKESELKPLDVTMLFGPKSPAESLS